MADKAFPFTIEVTVEEIKRIFEAGIRYGNHEATPYDWDRWPTGNKYDNVIDILMVI